LNEKWGLSEVAVKTYMNILFIVPYVPNLIRTRPYNLIRGLVKAGNRVTVYTLWSELNESKDINHLKGDGVETRALPITRWRSLWNCVAALPSKTPLQAAYCWQPKLAELLSRAVNNGNKPFDVIHVEHLRGAQYGLYLKSRYPQMPVVWDSVDCISYLFEQASERSQSLFGKLVTSLELNRTRRFEGWLAPRFDHVLITSAKDKEALLTLIPEEKKAPPVSTLPNGVDLEYFHPDERVSREVSTLVLSGKMSYHANVTMALYLVNEIMPLVWEKLPGVRLNIVGKDPSPQVIALGRHPLITVTGTVADIRPYLQRATAAVVPLVYGAGVQNKVLEAMACGTPVVATPGAVAALNLTPGENILIGKSAQEFADQVVRLIEDAACRRRIGNAGRIYVEQHHNWSSIVARLEEIYHEVVDHKT
jgi:sugar transferase (PEP-CTERM/EpsH1 system associated)